MASLDFDKLNKALSAILTLISLGGQFAVYGLEIYNHLKAQYGMTDEEIRNHRDLTLDANERKLLENLATYKEGAQHGSEPLGDGGEVTGPGK